MNQARTRQAIEDSNSYAADRSGRVVVRTLERREPVVHVPRITRIPAALLFRREPRAQRDEGGQR